jgi:DNA-binding response OmpR family regulator
MKVLLVEDDPDLGANLHQVLQGAQFASTWVRSAEHAERFLAAEVFDMTLLDIMLPGNTGLQLLQWLRAKGMQTPVIMLTARDAVSDRVLGLDAGADDYLAKPFAIEELFSRMRAVFRRQTAHKSALWSVGNLHIHTERRTVRMGDKDLGLAPREFDLLLVLAANVGKVVTRHQLGKCSADQLAMDSNVLDVHIHALRKKLGIERISTVRGVGYILEDLGEDHGSVI